MWFERPITGETLPEGHLCLTFDDGPAPQTLEIARYLSHRRIPAVFFVVGSRAASDPSILRDIVSLGHTLGNHTMTHLRLTASSTPDERAVHEVYAVEEILVNAGAQKPVLFRPPYGAWNRRLAHLFDNEARLAAQTGPIHWDIDGEDHRYWRRRLSPDACARNYLAAIGSQPRHSGIVLFHDGTAEEKHRSIPTRTYEMLGLLVPQLVAQGHRFAALDGVVSAIGIEPIT